MRPLQFTSVFVFVFLKISSVFLAFQAGLASSLGARGQGGEGAGYWAVAGWVSSDHGLLDAPEEAHGKDHEEKLQRKEEGDPGSGWCTLRGYPACFLREFLTPPRTSMYLPSV